MKKSTSIWLRLFKSRISWLLPLIVLSFGILSASAGSFSSDFNSGLPAGTSVYGVATVADSGGFTNSGVLELTTAVNNVTGSFIINDLDAGVPIQSFVAQFKVLIGGGTGADGFSFNFGDVSDSAFGLNGSGSVLTVQFDTYANTDIGQTGPAIRIVSAGVTTEFLTPLRTGSAFVDVLIKLNPDNTLDVIYNGTTIVSNLTVGVVNTAGRFALGANTGGVNDNHFIDNLNIVTKTAVAPYVDSAAPLGSAVRPDAALNVVLKDSTTLVDTNSIILSLDGLAVVPTITTNGAGTTTVHYQPSTIFTFASTHSVNITFADNGTPTITNNFQYGFTVASFSALATNLAAPLAYVDTNSPGFTIRVSQIAEDRGATVARAENQLANLLIDPATGAPYANLANPNPANGSFTYYETNAINFADGTGQGNFPTDAPIPGIPGSLGTGQNVALDAVTYLYLSPGIYTLGVNSSDGFRLTTAVNADVFAGQQAVFDGARIAADTTVTFQVSLDGYYPFRLLYFAGGGTTTPASVEFFSIDANGVKTLINDSNVVSSIKGFKVAVSHPFIESTSPTPNETGVPNNAGISISLVDGTLTVVNSSIQLSLNGTVVTPTKTTSGTVPNVTTISYTPPANFPPNSTNTVQLIYTDSGSQTTTNQFTFVTALNLSQIWTIAPAPASSINYVTGATTERGLAYNPATDHVLIVSRSTTPPTIAIYNAANGAYLSNLNNSIISGGGFTLNMVDVADDGVIYAANLTTAAGNQPFKIYRWQNEGAVPTVAYSGNPAPIFIRFGDTFRVRRAGSGTQLIANGNSPATNAAFFTTIDGTNFTSILLNVSGIGAGDLRLGCAFGCGNTFYGAQTAAPNTQMRYVGFDPVSGVASALATYILNVPTAGNVGAASVGPIGVDQASQRLIGNATSGTAGDTHSMNLYDLATLAPSPTINAAVDQKKFVTTAANFGTGAIDFTPNGDRVFTLDSANGVIAFGLTPTPANPAICTPPAAATNRVGTLAFFGVEGAGTPKFYQWRFNGTNIATQTNANLSIANIQRTNAGLYSVIIFNQLGGVTSAPVRLSVIATILTQPTNQVVSQGATATFVSLADGEAPVTYQWRFNENPIPNKTNATLIITNAQLADAGNYSVVAINPIGQEISQNATLNVVTPGATDGTGTGLTGDYYSSQDKTFTAPPTLTRLDPTVDFDWGTGSPDPSISVDTFTARWIGQVQPRYSQTYTFYTTTDDGVRLWVNGSLIINKWVSQPPTEWSGTIALNANQKYSILMEYYEDVDTAAAHLSWGSPSEVKAIIPMTQLYPGTSGAVSSFSSSGVSGSNLIINWAGTYTLQSSTDVAGPYADVTGATVSPYTNSITSSPQMFFRLRN